MPIFLQNKLYVVLSGCHQWGVYTIQMTGHLWHIIHDNITCLEATHEVVKARRGDIDDVSDVIKVGEVELQFLPELSLTLR